MSCYWLLYAGQEDTEDDTSKFSEVRSGRHWKAGCYRCCIRDDERVSHQTENFTGAHQRLGQPPKMANIAVLIGRLLVNALASTGSSYMFSRLSKDDIARE